LAGPAGKEKIMPIGVKILRTELVIHDAPVAPD
jgi:hypothetical protein